MPCGFDWDNVLPAFFAAAGWLVVSELVSATLSATLLSPVPLLFDGSLLRSELRSELRSGGGVLSAGAVGREFLLLSVSVITNLSAAVAPNAPVSQECLGRWL